MAQQQWEMRGEYMESCNCDYLCPCIYTNPQGPATHDHCIAAISDGEVLADFVIRVAFALDPLEWTHALGRDVIEIVFRKHVADAIVCGERQAAIDAQRREPARGALAIHGVDDRRDLGRRGGVAVIDR